MLAGLTNEQTSNFNYTLSADGTTGTLLGVGVLVNRNFRSNEFEYYVQDAFRPLPNLTLTMGLRHTILQTPYETNGAAGSADDRYAPMVSNAWSTGSGRRNSVQPEIYICALSGQARGAKPFYPMNIGTISHHALPSRLRLARLMAARGSINCWAAPERVRSVPAMACTTITMGRGLVTNYSKSGSFSLSSSITNPASVQTADTTPRFTGLHNLPNLVSLPASSSIGYPQTPSNDPSGTRGLRSRTVWTIISRRRTRMSLIFSFQRELPRGFTLEANYVGRLGRHLLQLRSIWLSLSI